MFPLYVTFPYVTVGVSVRACVTVVAACVCVTVVAAMFGNAKRNVLI